MILTESEIKKILPKKELSDIEMLNVIETYIKEKKDKTISIKIPDNIFAIQLMDQAYNTALAYFNNKYNKYNK